MKALLPGLIHEGALTLIAKRKGDGTTTVALEMAYAFASARSFCGHRLERRQVLLLCSHNDVAVNRSRVEMIDAVRERGVKLPPFADDDTVPTFKVIGIDAECEGNLPKDPAEAAIYEFVTSLRTAEREGMSKPLIIVDSLDCLLCDGTLATHKVASRVIRRLAAMDLSIVVFVDRCMARDDWDASHIANAAATNAVLKDDFLTVSHSKLCAPDFRAAFRIIAIEALSGTVPVMLYRGPQFVPDLRSKNPIYEGFAAGFDVDPVRRAVERAVCIPLIEGKIGTADQIVPLVRDAFSGEPGNEAEQVLDALRTRLH